ncbi:ABC transporter permease subunit [Fredinandcohnia sp. QZ13]|uniref:ABC transporter permease subunit n=1 Tax=Fredinandcohnia sp. QZ13 TaxID=3073144 RepID=UPI00285321FB|nr:ABC transporter permease subunit [Fredinandcohnia sp. QZ13]MDR4888078.1 ABC transporter permease subunit [Fredinandcohnia sp. QZ13]
MKTSFLKVVWKQLALWFISTILLLLIIFIPRDVIYETSKYGDIQKIVYDYSVAQHVGNIKEFFTFLQENHGLGFYSDGDSVESHVLTTSGRSLLLIIPAIFIGFFLGIIKGVIDYLLKNKKTGVGSGMTWFMLSIPDLFFMIGLQLLLMFLYEIGLFPHIDLYGHEKLENVIVCILFLAMYPLFLIANITYTSLVEEETKDHIRTAKSKGISRFKTITLHMLKNALQKINVNSNTMTLYVLSNLFIVEFLTNYRGAAFYFYKAIAAPRRFVEGTSFHMNTNSAVGFVFVFTIIILLSNLLFLWLSHLVSPKGKEA